MHDCGFSSVKLHHEDNRRSVITHGCTHTLDELGDAMYKTYLLASLPNVGQRRMGRKISASINGKVTSNRFREPILQVESGRSNCMRVEDVCAWH